MNKWRRNLYWVIVSVVYSIVVFPAYAANFNWVGGSGNNLWNIPDNWSPVGLPTIADYVYIVDANDFVAIDGTVDATCARLYGPEDGDDLLQMIGGALKSAAFWEYPNTYGSSGEVQISGGTVNVGTYWTIGSYGTGTATITDGVVNTTNSLELGRERSSAAVYAQGTLNLEGGTINTGSYVRIGKYGVGICNMSGGVINVGTDIEMCQENSNPHSYGELNVEDGTINVGTFLRISKYGDAVVNMSGGTINIGTYLLITDQPGASGELNMSGGTINVNSTASYGFQIARYGLGKFHMTGGRLNIKNREFITCSYVGGYAEILMDGGDINAGTYVTLGLNDDSTWIMNGGTLTIAQALNIGGPVSSTGKGYFEFNGGTITLGRPGYTDLTINDNSTLNMTGTALMIIRGDAVSYVDNLIAANKLIAYNGQGVVDVEYGSAENVTRVTCHHPYYPTPADGANVMAGSCLLEWTLPEPTNPSAVITCDVRFGTDPNIPDNPKIINDQAVESATVTVVDYQTYYWQITIYEDGVKSIEGPVFTFNTYNQDPTVDTGNGIQTWLVSGPRQVQMNPSVTDDGRIGPLAYHWTVITDANDLNPSGFINPDIKNAVAELKEVGVYVLQLEVFDGEFTVSDTVSVTVFADACVHAAAQLGFEWLAEDINHDCVVDMEDFNKIAETWLMENYSLE